MVPGDGWRRCGENICYIPNKYTKLPCVSAISPPPPPVLLTLPSSAVGASGSGTASYSSTPVVATAGATPTSVTASSPASATSAAVPLATAGNGAAPASAAAIAANTAPSGTTATTTAAADALRQGSVYCVPGAPSGQPQPQQQLFSETWSVVFPAGTTVAFFAYCQPYTMTDLLFDLRRWEVRSNRVVAGDTVGVEEAGAIPLQPATALPHGAMDNPHAEPGAVTDGDGLRVMPPTVGACFTSDVMVRGVLCRSLGGNVAPLLTITDFSAPVDAIARRPYVVLSAR